MDKEKVIEELCKVKDELKRLYKKTINLTNVIIYSEINEFIVNSEIFKYKLLLFNVCKTIYRYNVYRLFGIEIFKDIREIYTDDRIYSMLDELVNCGVLISYKLNNDSCKDKKVYEIKNDIKLRIVYEYSKTIIEITAKDLSNEN